MTKQDAIQLKIGDKLSKGDRTAKVIQPAYPNHVMIKWIDDKSMECPYIEYMDTFTKV